MQQLNEDRFRHRDLNWLSFNERVLQEAADKINPLYERMKFLAIFSSNLDEYFRVRVSQLRQMKRVKKSIRKKLALRPSKITKQIIQEVKKQQNDFGDIYHNHIIPELAENGIHIRDAEHYSDTHKKFVDSFFNNKVEKHIKPIVLDLENENELFLENSVLYFLITFKNENKLAVINIPVEDCGRFVMMDDVQDEHNITYLDEIVRHEAFKIFPEDDITGIYEIKLSRDAELYIDDIYEGVLAEKIYISLKQRTEGQPTRLLYDAKMPKEVQKKIRKLLKLGKIDMMPGGQYHNFKDFFSFPDPTNNKKLHFKELPALPHKTLDKSKDYFKAIAEKDQSLHFPYMSFSYVEKFVDMAAEDKDVTEISISLYRVADESELTNSLMKALKNGKRVTVFVEAKARFDEENNISWGRKFEEKGANVIYSFPKVKVHSKIMLISRQEGDENVKYAYIGTGNFNAETSAIYCDHAIFTANKNITKELYRLFKVLEGELIIPREKNLLISPFSTRQEFTKLIYNEIENAREGKKAKITAKMNSLEDEDIIELLYKASNAGVEIRMLIRGFTCLIPGVKDLSENIYITSVVDRFLEHGRIYLFENGGDDLMFYGSADWMNRNLDRRIEVISPVLDDDIKQEFKDILDIQLNDNVKARIQDPEETNKYVQREEGEKEIRSQYSIYEYLKKKHAT
ncbi:polyphosphate kinase 1 [Christiangramia forsetii]|uniref:Polyphosphate kinase n=2 Tax=Christiangramia forsetii TaxID=411153 RepID=A0M1U9_CHRFK|nr:polyphosphate kinase 1 [Christiangramia forsetii]GGG45303.1 polyphosphate kinase [Christiangramia forsetii]CAL66594.1 polyphosphate kinase [Christiangramia forsetii KT0803]